MTPRRICFDEIMTSDLLYYDPALKEICRDFCEKRNIDCLPSLGDPLKFFRNSDNGFYEAQVAEERRVNSHDFIFETSVLKRFHDNHLLFVYTHDELTGVVHFSDYNRPAVDAYLFDLLSSYERSLRILLKLKGLRNEDMLEYFQHIAQTAKKEEDKSYYHGKLAEYEKYQARDEKLPVFERFYLKDLIDLARKQKIIAVHDSGNNLRNMVMHAHELVNMKDPNRDDYIYDFSTFEIFFKKVIELLQDYKKVNNRIALLQFED